MLLLFVSAELPPELAEARADTAMAKALLVLIPPPPLLLPEMQSRFGQSLKISGKGDGLTKVGEIDVSEVVVEALREMVGPNVEERRGRIFRWKTGGSLTRICIWNFEVSFINSLNNLMETCVLGHLLQFS